MSASINKRKVWCKYCHIWVEVMDYGSIWRCPLCKEIIQDDKPIPKSENRHA